MRPVLMHSSEVPRAQLSLHVDVNRAAACLIADIQNQSTWSHFRFHDVHRVYVTELGWSVSDATHVMNDFTLCKAALGQH